MAAQFFERKDPSNYSLGGVRLWVNELDDATTTPPKYQGFVDLGCIEEAPIAQAIEFQEHFCAATGTRVKDRKIVKEVSATITATLIEPDVENLRLFFLGDVVTANAAGTASGSQLDEVVKLEGTERRILKFGRAATSIVVTSFDGMTIHTLNTDYVVEDYFGHKAIRRVGVPGNPITDGAYVLVDYAYDILQNNQFNPLTKILKTAQVLFIAVSDTGNEFIAQFDNCQINPSGDFNWNSDDFTTFALEIDVLDDSTANPSTPFGTIRHYGTNQNL